MVFDLRIEDGKLSLRWVLILALGPGEYKTLVQKAERI
jgi:hypothetical protein